MTIVMITIVMFYTLLDHYIMTFNEFCKLKQFKNIFKKEIKTYNDFYYKVKGYQ
jgi:hypothetical protein